MDFHLLYSGPLHSSGSDVQRNEKHAIRKVFHSQLRHLWETHPNLVMMAEGNGDFGITQQESEAMPKPELFQRGVEHIARNWHRNGFQFLPLVTKKVCLRCSLDILFLRAEERNYVLQGGDIDRRLTILFDALRIAREASELPVGAKPAESENPFFCLLENDDLISELHVTTDRLLKLPDDRPMDQHDVYLQITVRLNTTIKVANCWVFE
ncbi:MAG: hypothetical protein WA320_05235 [Candidatus Sulfotelmatobacter sp.]